MPAIKSVKAWKIAKSNGNCTVIVDVKLFGGTLVRAGVPSGPFTGFCEGLHLRDAGLGFMNGWIARSLIGKELTEATRFEHVMRLTGPFHEWRCGDMIGPGALLAVLLAVWKAGATVKKIPLYKYAAGFHNNTTLVLPVPAFNVINGSSHAINKLAMQEFMILPVGASYFEEAVKMGVEVYCLLKVVIKKKYEQDATNVGDEGGFAPNIRENKEGLKLLKTAIAEAGYIGKENKEGLKLLKTAIAEAGYIGKVVIGLDVPASEFYGYKDKEEDKSFVVDYPVVSILDPNEIGEAVQIVSDDLLVRNPKRRRVEKAIEEKSCNALLLKLIGKKLGAEAIYAGVMVCATCEDRRTGSCSNLWWSPV